MVTVYLSLGSNLGNRRENLDCAIARLEAEGVEPGRRASLYETEPVGFREQPWFFNTVLEAATELKPDQLLSACQRVETSLGRIRNFRNAPRTVDIDILLYGDLVLQAPGLVIPHPRMAERRFVLAPLAEIAPGLVHPGLHRTAEWLLRHCEDSSTVRLFKLEDGGKCENT